MKTILPLILSLFLASRLAGFEWPGGTMSVPVVFRGEEVFAGWVPSSPWGSTPFLNDPAVELRDAADNVIAQQVIGGNAMQWYEGGTRSGTAVFTVPAGTYSLTTRTGTRLIRISGEGWSGFRLAEDSLTLPVPPNSPPVISWIGAPAGAASGESYTVSARGHDDDGNLAQVNVWKNGTPFAFAGGGNGTDGDSGNATSDGGPQTVTFTAQAVDADGAASAVISHVVTIAPPPPAQFTLVTLAGAGGTVSAGGTWPAGSTPFVTATPDGAHDFVGWSGDAGGSANPLAVLMDRDRTVQANFALKSFTLTTSAAGGGAVTPGGAYPFGSTVTVTASADASHYFTGWTGDAGGTAPSVAILIDRAKIAQATFAPKAAQTISFTGPGNQGVGAVVPLAATSSAGLPVGFVVVDGSATLDGATLTVTGPGPVTVQAFQDGDAWTLPALPVAATFNASAPVVVRYRPAARTLLRDGRTTSAGNYVLGNP